MKKADIKKHLEKPELELKQFIENQREALRKLTFDLAQGKVKKIQALRETKKAIARALTELSKRAKKI